MPTLSTRSVSGTCKDASGGVYRDKVMYFRPVAVFGADGVTITTGNILVRTDAVNGSFQANLFTVDATGAFVRYCCELPSGESVEFDLEAGGNVTLDVLIDQTALTKSPLPAVQAALAAMFTAARLAAQIDATTAPATATSPGAVGQIAKDANYIYICVAINTWKRAALSTW